MVTHNETFSEEYISRLKTIHKNMHGRDYYFSFPTRFVFNSICPTFFSKFLIVNVSKQKYPAFFRVVRLMRDNSVCLPVDTFAERISEEIEKGKYPIVVMPYVISSDLFLEEESIKIATLEHAQEKFEQWCGDVWLRDAIPPKIKRKTDFELNKIREKKVKEMES